MNIHIKAKNVKRKLGMHLLFRLCFHLKKLVYFLWTSAYCWTCVCIGGLFVCCSFHMCIYIRCAWKWMVVAVLLVFFVLFLLFAFLPAYTHFVHLLPLHLYAPFIFVSTSFFFFVWMHFVFQLSLPLIYLHWIQLRKNQLHFTKKKIFSFILCSSAVSKISSRHAHWVVAL